MLGVSQHFFQGWGCFVLFFFFLLFFTLSERVIALHLDVSTNCCWFIATFCCSSRIFFTRLQTSWAIKSIRQFSYLSSTYSINLEICLSPKVFQLHLHRLFHFFPSGLKFTTLLLIRWMSDLLVCTQIEKNRESGQGPAGSNGFPLLMIANTVNWSSTLNTRLCTQTHTYYLLSINDKWLFKADCCGTEQEA